MKSLLKKLYALTFGVAPTTPAIPVEYARPVEDPQSPFFKGSRWTKPTSRKSQIKKAKKRHHNKRGANGQRKRRY